ncbi:MAG: hypothetical protein H0V51_00100 [Chloroflexi bacterium]|nr:hypothetical protein [Chloroflexota bacterium]
MKLRARLSGLALIVLGFVGFGLIYLLWSIGATLAPRPPLPPGMRPDLVPVISPFTCILPLAAIASSLLVLEGLRRTILPE